MEENNIFKDLVRVTSRYLGPSAERFVERQIETHLNKKPLALQSHDLPPLIEWMRISMAVIADSEKLLNEYEDELKYVQTRYKKDARHASKK